MKGLFIISETNEMHKHFESFAELGHEVATYKYHYRARPESPRGAALDAEVREAARACKPDVIVYIGACAGNLPSPELFAELRKDVAPTVHLVSDAADEPWWPILRVYDQQESFSSIVAVDGNKEWPLADKHITALTPVPLAYYPKPIPHAQRRMLFGFAGNAGNYHQLPGGAKVGRQWFIQPMTHFGLECRQRDVDGYAGYRSCAEWNRQSRITPNFPLTGSYTRFHVKGRVMEAALAGCLLLEQKGSPTGDWFEPGVDYLVWETVDEARAIVERYAKDPDGSEAFGMRLHAKALAEHSPAHFWGRIFRHAGLPA